MTKNYISIKRIAEKLNMSESSAWEYTRKGGFPAKIQLSPRCSRWDEQEVNQWVESHLSLVA